MPPRSSCVALPSSAQTTQKRRTSPNAFGETSAAVESASASSPVRATTVTCRQRCAGHPVAGSMTWPLIARP